MTKLDKLAIAVDTAEVIGIFEDCEAIAVLNMKEILIWQHFWLNHLTELKMS